jgi:nucleotide-binding universal stress UspA family protein
VAAADRMGEGVVVLGSSPGRIHGQALGGVARRVVRRSRRPLLLAPQRRDDPR